MNKINEHKRKIAQIYDGQILNSVIKPVEAVDNYHVYHIYNIRTTYRDELKYYLLEYGVSTEIHYPVSPNKQEGYKHLFSNEEFRISEEIHATTLSLPISYSTSEEDAYYVSEKINRFFETKFR